MRGVPATASAQAAAGLLGALKPYGDLPTSNVSVAPAAFVLAGSADFSAMPVKPRFDVRFVHTQTGFVFPAASVAASTSLAMVQLGQ